MMSGWRGHGHQLEPSQIASLARKHALRVPDDVSAAAAVPDILPGVSLGASVSGRVVHAALDLTS